MVRRRTILKNEETQPDVGKIELPICNWYPYVTFDENRIPMLHCTMGFSLSGYTWFVHRSSPVSVVTNIKFSQVVAYGEMCAGINSSGSNVWTWGRNNYGQLGDSSITDRSSPVSVVGNHAFSSISGGGTAGEATSGHVAALKADGTAWGWGFNTVGEIGDNTATSRSSPVSVLGGHIFSKIIANQSGTIALKSTNGTVWCWGYNIFGQAGDGSITNRASPVSVLGGHSFIDIASSLHTLGLKSDGSAWAWGYNAAGQLGDNSVASRSSPVSVLGGHSFIKLAGSKVLSFGLKADGSIWGWGDGNYVGDQSGVNRSSPISVVGGHSFVDIFGAGSTYLGVQTAIYAKKSDNTIWSWGSNEYGFIGDNTTTSRNSPVLMLGQTCTTMPQAGNGYSNFIYLNNSQAWIVGRGDLNELGQNFAPRSSPVAIGIQSIANFSWTQVSTNGNCICCLDNNGSAWTWGFNPNGGLGDGTIISKSSPVSVIGNHSFVKIKVNGQSGVLGLKADGTMWTWGYGQTYGLNGDNTMADRSSPVSVVGNHFFVDMNIGAAHVLALKADGSLWGWGYNPPALGDNGGGSNRSSPVSVLRDLAFIKVSANQYGGFGLTRNGVLYSWGYNYNGVNGQGHGTTSTGDTRNNTPTAIGNHYFVDIPDNCTDSHMIALKSDGSVWAWGRNAEGQLGLGDVADRSTPVPVIGNHSFVKVAGGYFTSYAVKEDGSVWAWGYNIYGDLGTNDTIYRSSPVLTVLNAWVKY